SPSNWTTSRLSSRNISITAGRSRRRALAVGYPRVRLEPLDHDLGLHEELQIVRSTCLRIGAAHVEAAEGLGADHGAGDLAIEVQVADLEFGAGLLEAAPVAREDAACQAVLGVVGDRQRV